jgi:alanyl-tRNA synthetase
MCPPAPGRNAERSGAFLPRREEQRKQLEVLQAKLAELESKAASSAAEEYGGVRLVVSQLPASALQKTAQELAAQPGTIALLGASDQGVRLVFARSADVKVDVGALLKEVMPMVGGRGGGKPDFAQGGGTDASKVGEALDAAKAKAKAMLA